jgi:hypothetical protein
LKEQLPDLDEGIRFAVPILLDNVAVELGPWSGYHVLAQHRGCHPTLPRLRPFGASSDRRQSAF